MSLELPKRPNLALSIWRLDTPTKKKLLVKKYFLGIVLVICLSLFWQAFVNVTVEAKVIFKGKRRVDKTNNFCILVLVLLRYILSKL